jgi:hypothetical protein
MTFKKQFPNQLFLDALSTTEWKKTSEIAKKIRCSKDLVTKTLLTFEEVEFRWTSGGKCGTREWRLK